MNKHSIWTDEHAAFPLKRKDDRGTCGFAVDNDGTIYYTQFYCHTLFAIDRTRKTSRYHFADAKAHLSGIVFDGKEILYLCDTAGRVLRFDISTKKFQVIGKKPKGYQEDDGPLYLAQFYSPNGIDMDKHGDLYLTDGNRVRKIRIREGLVETIAGKEKSGYRDGPAKDARFSKPHGIIVKDDVIFVADHSNHCIRKIQNGVVSTIVGDPKKFSHLPYPSSLGWNFDGMLLVIDRYSLKTLDERTQLCVPMSLPRKYSFGLSSVQSDHRGNLFIGSDTIAHLQKTWKWERFLWIGKLKEDASYCCLAQLPPEIIQLIANFTKCACPCWLIV